MKYTTMGKMRGVCGHNHRSISGAFRCLVLDQNCCMKGGGYTDRGIVRTDGKDLTPSERHALDALLARQYRAKRGW
jgi:hypothetical protein